MAAVRRKMPLWVGYRVIARPSSLPKVKGVGVEAGCIGEVVGSRVVGDYAFVFWFREC